MKSTPGFVAINALSSAREAGVLGTVLLSELGFRPPAAQAAATVDEHGSIELWPEDLGLVEVREDERSFESNPLWPTLEVVQQRGVHEVGNHWEYGGAAAARIVLGDLRAALDRAGQLAVITALEATLGRLDAATDHGEVRAGVPTEAGWTRLRDALDDPSVVASWFATLRGTHPPDVAGSFLAGWLGDVVLAAPATALQTERRTWTIDPDRVWIHPHDEGWFDGVAVGDVALRVLPDDPAAGDGGVEVQADVGKLRRGVAADVVAVLDPLFRAVRQLAPFGRRGMWGSAADGLTAGAVWTALRAGDDSAAAFAAALALVDEIARAGGGPLTRPTALPITCRHGTITVSRRGTCCLWYKSAGGRARRRSVLHVLPPPGASAPARPLRRLVGRADAAR